MKTRIISAAVGLVVLFAVFGAFETIVPNLAVAIISADCVWELLHAVGCTKQKPLAVLSLLFAAVIPFLSTGFLAQHLPLVSYAFAVALFVLLLYRHEKVHVEQMAMAFFFTLVVPFSLSTLLFVRDRQGGTLGIFYAMVVFGSAWFSDSGAYFVGRFFGKHKLAPVVSPKKTVEGAIGGAVTATICVPLVGIIYTQIVNALGGQITISYLRLLIFVPIFSLVSILGDLCASVIKRQFGVKDYGSVMPGHGGLMDRFDSVLMVAPLVFIVSHYFPFA